jgi:hypothetical protein
MTGWRQQLALGLLSAALIALQLVLMQILAITQWHHFAYLVISTALLGFGASGTLLALTRNWCLAHDKILVPLLMIGSAGAMAAFGWLTQGLLRGFDSYLLFISGSQILRLFAIILIYLLPFLLGAGAIGLLFISGIDRIGKLYFANLLGSGLGGLIGLSLLWLLPPEQLPALLALAALTGGLLLIPGNSNGCRLVVLAGAAFCLTALLLPAPLHLSQYKDLQQTLNLPGARITASRPSPYGLVETVAAPALRFAPGLSLMYREQIPVTDAVFNNGNLVGAIFPQPPAGSPQLLSATTSALPFSLARPKKVLILHAGTGAEVGLALNQGAEEVVAVEPHSALLKLLQENYAEPLRDLFDRQRVSLKSVEPRTFLARTDQLYDLIMLPTVGSFGGNLGLFALQEQNSLTLEGLSAAWQRLQPQGLLCVNSWIDFPLRAPLRLATSIGQMLEEQGIAAPENQLVAVRSWGTISFCAKRAPLTDVELKHLDSYLEKYQFEALLADGTESDRAFHGSKLSNDDLNRLLPMAVSNDRAKLISSYPFKLAPTQDDRPFFSQYLHWRSLPQLNVLFGGSRLPFLELGYLVAVITLLQLSLAAVILILLPLLKLGRQAGQRCWTLSYFGSLGIGFMLVELSLIHRFILFLGTPVYAAATVISILLIFSGIGSHLSSRFRVSVGLLTRSCTLTAGLLVIYSLLLPLFLEKTVYLPFTGRIALTLLLLAPAGLAMGFPFPLGLRLLNQRQQAALPWAWGINGCLSVVSAALTVVLAAELGFTMVFWFAACAYAVAAASCLYNGKYHST